MDAAANHGENAGEHPQICSRVSSYVACGTNGDVVAHSVRGAVKSF